MRSVSADVGEYVVEGRGRDGGVEHAHARQQSAVHDDAAHTLVRRQVQRRPRAQRLSVQYDALAGRWVCGAHVAIDGRHVGVAVGSGRLAGRHAVAAVVVRHDVDAQLLGQVDEVRPHAAQVSRIAVREQQRGSAGRVADEYTSDALPPLGGYDGEVEARRRVALHALSPLCEQIHAVARAAVGRVFGFLHTVRAGRREEDEAAGDAVSAAAQRQTAEATEDVAHSAEINNMQPRSAGTASDGEVICTQHRD